MAIPYKKTAIWLALLLCSPPALASDYSGLPVVQYGFFGAIFAILFAVVWLLTKDISQRWLRVLVRCATAASFWAPINLGAGDSSAWWPVCCLFLDSSSAAEAPASILGTTLLLWVFIICLPQATNDAQGA